MAGQIRFKNFVTLRKLKTVFLLLCVSTVLIVVYMIDSGDLDREVAPPMRFVHTTSTERHIEDVSKTTDSEVRQGNFVRYSRKNSFVVKETSIALACAITTRKRGGSGSFIEQAADVAVKLQVFKRLLPSFCKTATKGYHYYFYFSYDFDDPYFSKKGSLRTFEDVFWRYMEKNCSKALNVHLAFVKCLHSGKPAWAQNDAAMAAYRDGISYFYRINDDTIMVNKTWAETFIGILAKYDPPNVGVVGPNATEGSHLGPDPFLIYDFVHRTHIDIFGYYYPPRYASWYADEWISFVYKFMKPCRYTKTAKLFVHHTRETGTRYAPDVQSGLGIYNVANNSSKIVYQWIKEHSHANDL